MKKGEGKLSQYQAIQLELYQKALVQRSLQHDTIIQNQRKELTDKTINPKQAEEQDFDKYAKMLLNEDGSNDPTI